ncbi:PREDICTED: chymotrypsin inhibitor-like isoform X3 [Polistes dominula]|uniref:Chymotrypsin inhibitor-like isoform X3 n=1 Tax=Polistes dominula TaxID=743375 RepID=A0ABM1I3I3_POLDO|nr:PREDICTED: chymotrypsin inhibitor-like isoform X3 [Polistes dominula]
MSNKLIILVLLVGIIYNTSAAPERPACGPNQIFDTCGTACPPTCKKPSPDVCILLCVSGCRCKDGFVKNDNGDCVLTKDC